MQSLKKIVGALSALVVFGASLPAWASPFGLTYGGRLTKADGSPITGTVTLSVSFYDAYQDGNKLGPTFSIPNVTPQGGVFSIHIPASDSQLNDLMSTTASPWIQVRDETNKVDYERQLFTAVPYALKVPIDPNVLKYDTSGRLTLSAPPENGKFLSAAGGSLQWVTAPASGSGISDQSNATAVTIDSQEHVGIGTTNPTTALEVNGLIQANNNGSQNGFSGFIWGPPTSPLISIGWPGSTADTNYIKSASGDNHSLQIGAASTGSSTISFDTSGVGRMLIDATGKVGIGTSAPAYPLDVATGTTNLGSTLWGTIPEVEVPKPLLKLGWSDRVLRYDNGVKSLLHLNAWTPYRGWNAGTAITIGSDSGTLNQGQATALGRMVVNTDLSNSNASFMALQTTKSLGGWNNGLGLWPNGSVTVNYARYDTLGAEPWLDWGSPATFSVRGVSGLASLRIAATDDTAQMLVTEAGAVGIGTATPAATLDVNGFLKLKKNSSAPIACNATQDGSVGMTSTYRFCACKNGTGWVYTSDGTTACVW